jgi:G3E family GTPase
LKVIIIYGFLGAGKTTLIRHLLSQAAEPGKIAVLVNDFGAVNVDGAVIAGQHLQVVPLASGCICCTLAGAFAPAVEELRSRWNPEWLLVEPTGVAAPYAMEAMLAEQRLALVAELAGVVAVVDAYRFLDYRPKLGEFYTAQVQHAGVVLLNKVDRATAEQLAQVKAAIAALNQAAQVHITEHCRVGWDIVLGAAAPDRPSNYLHAEGPGFQTLALPAPPLSRTALERFFQRAPAGGYGELLRAKGIVAVDGAPALVNYDGGHLSLEPAGGPLTDLTFIGRDLNEPALLAALSAEFGKESAA